MSEAIPVQDSRDSHQRSKGGDRKKTDLDQMPARKGDDTNKEICPTNIGRAQHHCTHAWLDAPGEQLVCVIGEQVENGESGH